jgi:hypothetical protein
MKQLGFAAVVIMAVVASGVLLAQSDLTCKLRDSLPARTLSQAFRQL